MSKSEYNTKTNTEKKSTFDIEGYLMPAKTFFFVVVEEIGKDGFLVRKVYASIDNPHLLKKKLSYAQKLSETIPEKVGMTPRNINSTASIADHVLAIDEHTKYVSTSSDFPGGSPRMDGKTVYIDIEKAKKHGAKLITTDEIIFSLEEYIKKYPHTKDKTKWLIRKVRNVDKEVLIKTTRTPPNAIFTPKSYKNSQTIIRGAKVISTFGIAFTAYDLSCAVNESYKINSFKPVTAEVMRQAGGWGAGIAGFKIGAIAGAAIGIETGPGALVTGLVGGILFGSAGYFGADWIADYIYKN